MIFDTHSHYDDEAFDADREELLLSMKDRGIGCIMAVAASCDSQERVKRLTEQYDFIYGAVGVHPDEVGGLTPELMHRIGELLGDPKILAVGEIGLDYHWMVESREKQIRAFAEQAAMAIRHEMPIIVHSRDAAEDTLQIVRELYGGAEASLLSEFCGSAEVSLFSESYGSAEVTLLSEPESPAEQASGEQATEAGGISWKQIASDGRNLSRKGIMHAYSYSVEQARIYVDMGFYLGIGGVVTFKNGKKLKRVVEEIPLEKLVLETDCPYLSPEPFRGRRNSSANLPYVVKAIADLKGVSEEEVEQVTWDNAVRLFFG